MENSRLEQIPILHVRGTHSVIGFTIGRQFRALIENVLEKSEFFNQQVLPEYETPKGQQIYAKTLEVCRLKFPKYIEEIQGIANGARVPFYKLFLLNMEFSITSADKLRTTDGESGCSTVMCNNENILIGHTEDAPPELLNNVFILSAEVLTEEGSKIEKFTTLAYAGCLPGFTMGFNEHGLIYTVNTLYPLQTCPGRTPRSFLARAILKASSLDKVLEILKDKGCGITDGFSLNIHFAKQEGSPKIYNVEVCPNPEADESIISVLTLNCGESYAHCNKFLRLQTPELPKASKSSEHRHRAMEKHAKPENMSTILNILSDRSDRVYSIFRYGGKEPDMISTVAVGIFDVHNRKWNIYIEPPNKSKPIAIISLDF